MRFKACPGWLSEYSYPRNLIDHELRSGLVGLWLPSLTQGNVALDLSSYQNHGSFTGTASSTITEIGEAWFFNGGRIDIGDEAELESSEITLFSVIQTTGGDTIGRIFHKYALGSPYSGYALSVGGQATDGKLNMWVGDTTAGWLTSANTVNDNIVHPVAGIYEGGLQTLYIDGKQAAQQNATASMASAISLTIGSQHDGDVALTAHLGPCAIWSRALSGSTIRQLSLDFWNTLFSQPLTNGLKAIVAGTSTVQLTWTDNSEHETGYSIERSTTSATAGFAGIDTVGAGVTTYDDAGLAADTYWYRVRALSATLGNSEYSNVVEITVS